MAGFMKNIANGVRKLGTRVGRSLGKASPTLLTAGGIGLLIGGTVVACMSTGKANDILNECDIEVGEIKNEAKKEDCVIANPNREIAKVKVKTFGKLALNYAPAAVMELAGTVMIGGGHHMLKKDNGKLLAACAAYDSMIRSYRAGVLAEDDGEDRDARCLDKPQYELTDYEDVDEANAEELMSKAMSSSGGHTYNSPYVFEFSQYTSGIFDNKNQLLNINHIKAAEDNAALKMRFRGKGDWFTISEALRELDIDPADYPWTPFCGWPNDGTAEIELGYFLNEDETIRIEFRNARPIEW